MDDDGTQGLPPKMQASSAQPKFMTLVLRGWRATMKDEKQLQL